uniref:BTB domain-containing protein n=1 Tax=Panagrolaimus davidi TaxID=227884 RepID=A0A914QRZ9_9BILA
MPTVSATLNSWLSDRWTTKDKIIKIEDYSYDNFYQFLCFIYIGKCLLTVETISQLIDMAEYYAVECLKELCDNYFSKISNNTLENV